MQNWFSQNPSFSWIHVEKKKCSKEKCVGYEELKMCRLEKCAGNKYAEDIKMCQLKKCSGRPQCVQSSVQMWKCAKRKKKCAKRLKKCAGQGAPQCAQSSVTFCSGSSPAPLSLSGALCWTWMSTTLWWIVLQKYKNAKIWKFHNTLPNSINGLLWWTWMCTTLWCRVPQFTVHYVHCAVLLVTCNVWVSVYSTLHNAL